MKRMNNHGFSVIEVMLAAGILAAMMLAVSQTGTPITRFFQRNRVRQETLLEARSCIETLQRALADGKADTLSIANSTVAPVMPNGQANFTATDGSVYR